ncbi:hypothetical protein NXT3_CH03282 [Sinorhizobium fredii]|uniref:Uncharacterized protein n=2 Tax=Rhizobium fredii TaxID=380 RepID=A0A2L0H8P5_RHIFR|nr:hypothetical protein NXT3_CH03282 [Sinorhizobium fredii]
MVEPIAASDKTFRSIVETLTPMDTFVIASLGVLADTPTALIGRLSRVIATGCKLIIADLPHVDIGTIRQTAMAFVPLEQKAEKLSTELDSLYASRSEERATYARECQRQIIDTLYRRGIDLSDLLGDDKPKQPVDDIRGKRLRQLRESLSLSAAEAGPLVLAVGSDRAFSKQDVSEIETGKAKPEKMDLYEIAIRAEVGRRKVAAKLDREIAKQSGQPVTATEQEVLNRVIKPAQKGNDNAHI